MARYFLLSLTFLLWSTVALAQSALAGKVTDKETGEDLLAASIVLKKNGVFVIGTNTDFEGNYRVNVDPGTYDVTTTYVGVNPQTISGVLINSGKTTTLDIEMGTEDGVLLTEVIVKGYKVPLIDQDNTTSGATITADDIRTLPTKNITALAATAAGISQVDEGDGVTVRGSREDATDYYVDGMRVSGNSNLVPQSEIDQLQVITGGIEAQYGDVTGGIISITTKGPSSKYSGGLEVETSEYLDPFGYNLLSGNLSGPILKRKKGKNKGQSIIGFRFAGQYVTRKDDDPPATDVFVVKDEVLEALSAEPVIYIGASPRAAAEFLKDEDVDVLKYKPNERSTRLDLTGKIDARLSDAIDVTLTGAYNSSSDQFTPGSTPFRNSGSWRLMNSHNNPTEYDTRYRVNFRFRHRLGGGATAVTEGDDAAKRGSIFRNAQYILQAGYEKTQDDRYDPLHEQNLFNYGYIGQFDYEFNPTFNTEFDPVQQIPVTSHVGYNQQLTGYTPGTVNPGLTPYNAGINDPVNDTEYNYLNGFIQETPLLSIWSGMHTNVNQVYDFVRKRDNDRITVMANTSFDFYPGGSDKGSHSIQFGLLYEQRFNRSYSMSPFRLWQLGRQLTNNVHINGVDTSMVIGQVEGPNGFLIDQYAPFDNSDNLPNSKFLRSIRELTGQGLDEYVNIDMLTPDQLSLDMFSASELNNFNDLNLDYYGFDYLGNKLGNDVTFDDFFSARGEDGLRTFPVAAVQPIYAAGYIQDKFTFKDIIFRVGLRLDYYDANTKVLKDPFSLYEIVGANDFYNSTGQERPAGVGDDYLVYTDGDNTDVVKAFREGEQWYFADGTPANDGNVIFGTSPVSPRYKEDDPNIKLEDFDPNTSFEDYEPQLNWMPRLAFSFPISDAANFFAHYDVLVQRPSNTIATALDYYYFPDQRQGTNGNNPFSNPALKPQRTIDYEVGFQQKLSNSSSIKLAAYYKEMRDMIQQRTFLYVPDVIQYVSYDNQDFGTVKGFTFQYDLRRTKNVRFTANYTLQFAEGTGSDANSSGGLSDNGNIRTLYPLSFDERHRLVTTIDYRYASGKLYDGPRVMGKDIFANTGVNLQAIAVSGRPYSATTLPSRFGGNGFEGQLNGARLPWNITLNLRIDKSFTVGKVGKGKTPLSFNAYLRVQNLLNQQNAIRVYSASGSASDDGFLASARGQDSINQLIGQGRDLDAFLNAYRWRMTNPDFYSLPRRIFLGLEFYF